MDEHDRYASGDQQRRAVLGDEWVDRAHARLNDFNRDFQDFITRCAWGEIWTRPGLDLRTRSCITLSMLIALGRWEEYRLHVRGAFNNGVTREQLKELILHSAIYAGVPAANAAMHQAELVMAELSEQSK